MTDDEDGFRDLAPLFALDALEPEEARAFAQHAEGCAGCRGERDAYAAVAGQLGVAVDAIAPPPALRARVLGATGTAAARPARRWLLALIAAALGLVLTGAALEIIQKTHRASRLRTAELQIVELLADGGSKVVLLAGQAGAPQASGRLVWNAQRRRVMVFASGLPPAPHGKRYELWTIAGGAPVASGLFDVKSHGLVAVPLEWLDVTPAASTFAITIEPAAGTPAPTGAMVLAGDAS